MFIHFWHFCLAEGLGMKLQDMAQYLRSIIPSEEVPEFDPPESKFTSVAILCPINFSKASSPSTLGHWISGWLSSELDDADALAHRWLTESSNVETATLSDLEAKLSMEKDEVLRKSLLLLLRTNFVHRPPMTYPSISLKLSWNASAWQTQKCWIDMD